MYDLIKKGLMFGTHYQTIDLNFGILYSLFDADFRGSPPVYDNGLSQTVMTTVRNNVQYKNGEIVPINTPVLDEFGIRTNGGYIVSNTYANDFTQWSKISGGVSADPVLTPAYTTTPKGFSATRFQGDLNGGITTSDSSQLRQTLTLSGADHNITVWARTLDESTHNIVLSLGGANSVEITPEWQRVAKNQSLTGVTTLRVGLLGGIGQPDTCDIAIAVCNVVDDLSYAMPEVITTTASVTVGFNHGKNTGVQEGSFWDMGVGGVLMPDLFGVLDGVADGVEKVANGDMESQSDWSPKAGVISWETADPISGTQSLSFDNSTGNEVSGPFQNIGLSASTRFQIIGKAKIVSGGNQDIRLLQSGAAGTGQLLVGTLVINAIQGDVVSFKFRWISSSDASKVSIQLAGDALNSIIIYDDISVKEISPAKGVATDTWRPGFSVDDVDNNTTINIWSVDGDPTHGLYALKDGLGDGYLVLNDGTNSVSVALDWENQDYIWTAVFDTDEMQIQYDDQASAVGTFAGSFGPGQYMYHALDNIYPQHTDRHLEFTGNVKDSDWKAPT